MTTQARPGVEVMMRAALCLVVLLSACRPDPAPPPPSPVEEQKVEAPVDLTLASSALRGEAVVTLDVTARADLPSASARLVLPPGVKLLSGSLHRDLGPMARDGRQQLRVTVSIPPAVDGAIHAGVTVQVASGVKLHRSAAPVVLGKPQPGPAVELLEVDGERVRMQRAR